MANPSIVVEFIAETQKLVSGVQEISKTGDQAAKATKGIEWKNVAKWGAAAAVVGAASTLVVKSVNATNELAKATMKLQRATGLEAKEASAWVTILKQRGIEVDAFQASLTKLSTLMEKVRKTQIVLREATADYLDASKQLNPIIDKGGEAGKQAAKELSKWGGALQKAQTAADKAAAPFEALGIKLADVKKGDIGAVLLQAADGFSKIKNPATRAALAAQLFGRQGNKILPIMMSGSAGIKEQQKLIEKYGLTMDQNMLDKVKETAKAQKELDLAQKGVSVTLGSALIPAQAQLYGTLLDLVRVLFPLIDNVTVMKIGLIAGAIAFGIYKVAVIASTIAQLGLNAAMLPTILVIAGIVLAVAALIAIGILLYKNWDKVQEMAGKVWDAIKRAAQSVLSWFKANWPYILGVLTGPFGLAIALIYKHWDAIKKVFGDALTWGASIGDKIKDGVVGGLQRIGVEAWGVINNIGSVIGQYAGVIAGWGKAIGGGIYGGIIGALAGLGAAVTGIVKGALNAAIAAWNKLKIPSFKINMPKPIPDVKFPGFPLPNIAMLAKGGIVTRPTLAMLGEAGPEMVTPLGSSTAPIEVKVFIGDTELKGMVRYEVVTENQRTAQVLLAGAS